MEIKLGDVTRKLTEEEVKSVLGQDPTISHERVRNAGDSLNTVLKSMDADVLTIRVEGGSTPSIIDIPFLRQHLIASMGVEINPIEGIDGLMKQDEDVTQNWIEGFQTELTRSQPIMCKICFPNHPALSKNWNLR